MSSSINKYTYKSFTTSRSLTYSYIHISPSSPHKPYILFLHGFPSDSYLWHYQITHFTSLGYGVIVPDILGFGGTDKPLDWNLYSGKGMSEDIYELVKSEDVEKMVGIAHDWGSELLSRLANYHPELFTHYAFLDIGYNKPGPGLSSKIIPFINNQVREALGYEVFGYFLFFDEEGATKLLDENVESALTLFYGEDVEQGKKYMGRTGGFREWLEEGKAGKWPEWFSEEEREYTINLLKRGGFGAPINWYRAQLHEVNAADWNSIPEKDQVVKEPTLLISGNNFISATADFPGQMKGVCENLRVETLNAGHWMMIEKQKEVNELLEEFIEGK